MIAIARKSVSQYYYFLMPFDIYNEMKLVLKSRKPKRLMELEVHHDGREMRDC
jgi:hypothetical protein